jgi:hypothetical protein
MASNNILSSSKSSEIDPFRRGNPVSKSVENNDTLREVFPMHLLRVLYIKELNLEKIQIISVFVL